MLQPTQRAGGAWKRMGILLGYSAAVIASLLTFPVGIPWVVAFWQAVFCVCLVFEGNPLWPVSTCAAILAVKGTSLNPGFLWLLLQVVIAIYVAAFPFRKTGRNHSNAIATGIIGGWLHWLLFVICWESGGLFRPRLTFEQGSAVVCLGDSLTLNEERTGGYPEVLQTMVDRPVRNLGQPGITTREAFSRFDELRRLRPGIVVIELGGHDFLKGRPRAEAKKNLERMIAVAREVGADVILFEIPRGFIHDPWWGLEREIARQQRVTLIPDGVIRSFVLYSPFAPPGMWTGGPYLSDDGLHPNQNGKVFMAKAVAGVISANSVTSNVGVGAGDGSLSWWSVSQLTLGIRAVLPPVHGGI